MAKVDPTDTAVRESLDFDVYRIEFTQISTILAGKDFHSTLHIVILGTVAEDDEREVLEFFRTVVVLILVAFGFSMSRIIGRW